MNVDVQLTAREGDLPRQANGQNSRTQSNEVFDADPQVTGGLFPVTAAEIVCNFDGAKNTFVVGNKEISHITMVAQVESIQTCSDKFIFTLDDKSGVCIEAHYWFDGEVLKKSALPRLRSYIRIFGAIKAFAGRTQLDMFPWMPVNEPDIITSHILRTVFAHHAALRPQIPVVQQRNDELAVVNEYDDSSNIRSPAAEVTGRLNTGLITPTRKPMRTSNTNTLTAGGGAKPQTTPPVAQTLSRLSTVTAHGSRNSFGGSNSYLDEDSLHAPVQSPNTLRRPAPQQQRAAQSNKTTPPSGISLTVSPESPVEFSVRSGVAGSPATPGNYSRSLQTAGRSVNAASFALKPTTHMPSKDFVVNDSYSPNAISADSNVNMAQVTPPMERVAPRVANMNQSGQSSVGGYPGLRANASNAAQLLDVRRPAPHQQLARSYNNPDFSPSSTSSLAVSPESNVNTSARLIGSPAVPKTSAVRPSSNISRVGQNNAVPDVRQGTGASSGTRSSGSLKQLAVAAWDDAVLTQIDPEAVTAATFGSNPTHMPPAKDLSNVKVHSRPPNTNVASVAAASNRTSMPYLRATGPAATRPMPYNVMHRTPGRGSSYLDEIVSYGSAQPSPPAGFHRPPPQQQQQMTQYNNPASPIGSSSKPWPDASGHASVRPPVALNTAGSTARSVGSVPGQSANVTGGRPSYAAAGNQQQYDAGAHASAAKQAFPPGGLRK